MEFVVSLLERLGQAGISLLLNPFYYLGVLIVMLQLRKQIFFERRLYSSRIHSMLSEGIKVVLWGLLGGVIGSLLMAFVGASLQPLAVIYMWVIALLLVWLRLRFLCLAYVIGVLGVINTVLNGIPGIDPAAEWYPWIEPLMNLHMPSLLALAGIMHIVEALLIRVQGAQLATPVFIEGKRGKLIGSYQFQGLWPVPLFLLVPTAMDGQPLPLTPFFGGEAMWASGWMFLAMPVMLGFTDMTVSLTPQRKAKRASGQLLVYGVLVTGLSLSAEWFPVMVLPAALLTILLHELLVWYVRWDERNRSPIYVHTNRGLTVLGILPNSPAEELGIRAGECIHKVNGQAVRTKEELHQALRLNPAFSRLEIIDLEGQHRFVQRALFEGEHHQLGIILAPDDDAEFYVIPKMYDRLRRFRTSLGQQTNRLEVRDDGANLPG